MWSHVAAAICLVGKVSPVLPCIPLASADSKCKLFFALFISCTGLLVVTAKFIKQNNCVLTGWNIKLYSVRDGQMVVFQVGPT